MEGKYLSLVTQQWRTAGKNWAVPYQCPNASLSRTLRHNTVPSSKQSELLLQVISPYENLNLFLYFSIFFKNSFYHGVLLSNILYISVIIFWKSSYKTAKICYQKTPCFMFLRTKGCFLKRLPNIPWDCFSSSISPNLRNNQIEL